MLLHRVLTALVGVPVVLAAIWFGPPWITALAGAAAVTGVWEAYRMYQRYVATEGIGPATGLPIWLGGVWALALVLAAALAANPQDFGRTAVAIMATGCLVSALWMVAAWRGLKPAAAAVCLVAPPVYVGGALACAVAIRGIENPSKLTGVGFPNAGSVGVLDSQIGVWWLLLAILSVYAADTGAFFVGRLVGRHRMAPGISPGKTWEGAAGGLAGATITAAIVGTITPVGLEVWQGAVVGVILGIVSPAGDLLESQVKRWAGVKDSGAIFPGHGGMLDRLDSLLPCFVLVYIVAVFLAVGS